MNTNRINSIDHSTSSGSAPDGAVTGSHTAWEDKFDIWRTVQQALRGRLRLALMIALGGAVSGAWVGSMLGKRLYTATGTIRVASVLPQVMKETDQNRPIAMFDGFIDGQREVMTSREMIRAAMQESTWQEAITGRRALTEEQFAAGLKIETRPRSDHVKVVFKHKDPSITAPAVRSLIASYEKAFTSDQKRAEAKRTEQLENRKAGLLAELRRLEDSVGRDGQPRSGAEIEPLLAAAGERVKKLRVALSDVQFALAGGPDPGLWQGASARTPGEVADEELLRSFASQQARVEVQLAEARSRGLGPTHRDTVRLTAMAEECREQVARYTEAVRARRAGSVTGGAPIALADRAASLQKLIQGAEAEVSKLVTLRALLKTFDEQVAVVRQNLNETTSRLDALGTEAALGGRLTVVNGGDRPMTALLDNRAKFAALGAMGGIMLPIGGLVIQATRRRRYRYADEVAADLLAHLPLVAVLPDAGEAAALGATAAHSIHDLRVRLQPRASNDQRTYLVTSTTSGEGKSSLAIALGLSFAAAGFKTLLIDGDLASRRLTLGFDAGEVQGVIEAAAGQEPVIRRTRMGLSFLSAGCGVPQDSFRLAPGATGRFLASVRKRFDVVLIDSDSILTGLAASVIAPHTDGVILALARGQERSLVQRAIRHIEILGAHPSAAVFNRADADDFRTILTDQTPSIAVAGRALPERLSRFGPLVGVTLASLSLTREEDLDLMPDGISLAKSDDAGRTLSLSSAETDAPRRAVA